MSQLPGIARARLHGDQAQVIVEAGQWRQETLSARLAQQNLSVSGIQGVEPVPEDAFTLLAHQQVGTAEDKGAEVR